MNILISALWVFTGILSPLMALFLYPFVRRMPRLCSPPYAIPAVTLVCLAFTLLPISPARYLYPHFAVSGLVLVTGYILLLRLGLKAPDALLTATMTILAIDQLWQIPIDIGLWHASVISAATGLATGAFSFMSIPLVFFFLGRVKFDNISYTALLVALELTLIATVSWHPFPGFAWNTYWLIWPWTAFFFLVFRSSWTGHQVLGPALPTSPNPGTGLQVHAAV